MADQTIYYVYEKATGDFAGSGVSLIENDTHDSTVVSPLETAEKEPEKIFRYDKQAQTWGLIEKDGSVKPATG